MTKSKIKTKITDNNAAAVTEYLLAHPNFFAEHAHVLTEINLAHDSGSASSLIERQVSVLRMQNHKTRAELHDATENARLNEQLSDKIHQLSIRLLSTEGLAKSVAETVSSLNTDFDIKSIKLRLFEDRIERTADTLGDLPDNVILTKSNDEAIGKLIKKLERNEVVCGQLNDKQIDRYFAERSDNIASAALIPLQSNLGVAHNKTFGVIGLGCTREDRFRRDLGTVFLTRLAELISHKLWLDLHAE